MESKTIENTNKDKNDAPDENKQLVETNNTLAVSEEFEDDDADFYYEVEEIVQMYITDTGVRMFEIKWKNYGPEYVFSKTRTIAFLNSFFYRSNTWEPEHNLNCPTILEEFLKKEERRKIEDTTDRKKQKSKESSKQQQKESSHPKGKDKTKEKSPILVEVHEEIQDEPDKKGKKKRKAKEERKRELLEESQDLQAMEEEEKQLKETNRKRKAMAEEEKKKDLFDRQNEQAKKRKKKQDTFVVHSVKGEPSNRKRTTDVHPKDIQNEDTNTKRRKLEEETKNKNEESKPNGAQTNGANTTPAGGGLPKRQLTIIGPSDPKLTSESSSTKSLTSNNAKTAKPKLGISKDYKPSFTNLKRPISLSSPASKLDITDILRQSVGGKLPSIPKFTTAQRLANQVKSLSSPTQREPDPSDTVQKQSNFNATTFTSEPVTQPSSNTPSVSPPQVFQTPPSSPSMSQRSSPPPPSSAIPRPADQNTRLRPNELEAMPMRRQTLRPDPRLIADNQRKLRIQNSTAFPTLFTADYVLKKGDKLISSIQLEGKQHCYHQAKIQKLIELSGNDHTVKISSFLCLKRLDEFLMDRPFSFLHITAKDQLIELSKLKSFLQVNEMVGVVSHVDAPTHALAVLSESDAKKLKNLPKDIDLASSPYTQLCAIFIEYLPPKPHVEFNDLDLPDEEFTWLRVTNYLKFDKRLIDLRTTSKFHVYGHSDAAQLLMRVVNGNKAYKKSATPDPSKPIYVMMFDRANQVAFSRNLLKHKREPSTQIWEFGAPDLSYPDMIPPSPIFPINTGGFVTTDIQNMIDNPNILEKISESISKFNSFPVVYGEWKLIIPHNFMYHFTRAIQDGESATRVQNAIISITVGLSKGNIQIMRLWPAENENLDAVSYMDKILRYYYKSFQYFVMVDDVGSISDETKEKHRGLDFIKSEDLFSTFT